MANTPVGAVRVRGVEGSGYRARRRRNAPQPAGNTLEWQTGKRGGAGQAYCPLRKGGFRWYQQPMQEVIFEVKEDEVDGGYVAVALGYAIATQGETVEELREMVREAVHCHFGGGDPEAMPSIIRLHFVKDEALAV